MNENDRKRLVELIGQRDVARDHTLARAYQQGRIDEFCAQNAISRDELDALEAEIGGGS